MKVHLIADSVLELTQEQPGYWKGVTQIGGQPFHVEAVAVVEAADSLSMLRLWRWLRRRASTRR